MYLTRVRRSLYFTEKNTQSKLPNWHDDDSDEYDEEDDVVIDGENNVSANKQAAANSSAGAGSKTTQNTSAGKDSAVDTGPETQSDVKDTNESTSQSA